MHFTLMFLFFLRICGHVFMCCLFNVSFYWLIFIGWLHFVIANRFPITFLYTNDNFHPQKTPDWTTRQTSFHAKRNKWIKWIPFLKYNCSIQSLLSKNIPRFSSLRKVKSGLVYENKAEMSLELWYAFVFEAVKLVELVFCLSFTSKESQTLIFLSPFRRFSK